MENKEKISGSCIKHCTLPFNNRSVYMKKSGKVVILFLVVFLLVGCMNYDVTMTINSNKSVNLEMNMKMNLLDFANDFVADDGMWSSIKNQIITNTCTSSCPYDENSIEYTNCFNDCVESANSSSMQEVPTEEEIKEYLDMYLNSDEFNEEEAQRKRVLEKELFFNMQKIIFTVFLGYYKSKE